MSHTTRFDAPGWKLASLIHNGDWSGPTKLLAWHKKDAIKDPLAKPDLEVAIDEDRVCRVVLPVEVPANRESPISIDLNALTTLFINAGRAMGVGQLSDKITSATESFE